MQLKFIAKKNFTLQTSYHGINAWQKCLVIHTIFKKISGHSSNCGTKYESDLVADIPNHIQLFFHKWISTFHVLSQRNMVHRGRRIIFLSRKKFTLFLVWLALRLSPWKTRKFLQIHETSNRNLCQLFRQKFSEFEIRSSPNYRVEIPR